MPNEFNRLTKETAERIAIELAARARDHRSVADDATIRWIERQLLAYPRRSCVNPPMTKAEMKVLGAIRALGGEGSGFQIHRQLVSDSKWAWLWAIGYGGMYAVLFRLERNGLLVSRWGQATAARGWHRPRLYTIIETN